MNQNEQSVAEDSFRIQDLLYLCRTKWHWFVISVIVALGVAFIYIKKTPPTYVRSASILIKDESKGDISSVLSEVDLFQTKSNVKNEVVAFQSISTMSDVVKRLNLHTDYHVEGRFHDHVIYGKSLPINVKFDTVPGEAYHRSLSVRLLGNNKVELSHFKLNTPGHELEEEDKVVKGELNQKIHTPVGVLTVVPTAVYSGKAFVPIFVNDVDMFTATRNYAGELSAALNGKETTIIDLSFSDVSPERAEDVLNTLIAVYNENWVKDKNQIAVSTSEFINERLAVIEKELGNVDEDISSFKSKNLVPDVAAVSNLYMTKSQTADAQLEQLNNSLYMAKYIREYMDKKDNAHQLLPANSGISAPAIEGQISEYNSLQLQRNNLAANSSENNPTIRDLDQALKSLRASIVTSIDNYVVTLNGQIANLQKTDRETSSRIAASPVQAKYLLSVERQQKVKETLYLFLLQKREENELSQTFTAYNTRIIQAATGSRQPVAPVSRNILLIAFVLGFAAPAAYFFLRETMNTKVRGRKDLDGLQIPFVGEIPLVQRPKKWYDLRKRPTLKNVYSVKAGKRNMINEAFRVLRTNLEFMMGKENKCNVLVISSFNPGSGKTYISMNLAASLAIKDQRVLVVDADLRHASSSQYVDSPKPGIAEYLAHKENDIEKIIVKGAHYKNLDIIPVGTIPPNPTELLSDDRFAALIAWARENYDTVILDCPPIELVADTQIVEKEADRTIFIVRAGLLERSMLPELDNIYRENKFKNMCIALNATKSSGGSYGYGYKYGYHYGYGYGYHYGQEKK